VDSLRGWWARDRGSDVGGQPASRAWNPREAHRTSRRTQWGLSPHAYRHPGLPALPPVHLLCGGGGPVGISGDPPPFGARAGVKHMLLFWGPWGLAFASGRRLGPAPMRSCAPPVAAPRRGPAWAPWSSHCDGSTSDLARSLRTAPSWRVVSAGRRPSVAPSRCCSRFAAPAAPLFGPAAGPRSGRFGALTRDPLPARTGPSCSKPFPAISLLVGSARRSSAPRPVCGACVRAQTGVTQTTGLKIRGSRFPYHDRGPRFGRLLPVAADSFAPLGASCASLFSCFWPRGSRGPTTLVAPPRGLWVRCATQRRGQ